MKDGFSGPRRERKVDSKGEDQQAQGLAGLGSSAMTGRFGCGKMCCYSERDSDSGRGVCQCNAFWLEGASVKQIGWMKEVRGQIIAQGTFTLLYVLVLCRWRRDTISVIHRTSTTVLIPYRTLLKKTFYAYAKDDNRRLGIYSAPNFHFILVSPSILPFQNSLLDFHDCSQFHI